MRKLNLLLATTVFASWIIGGVLLRLIKDHSQDHNIHLDILYVLVAGGSLALFYLARPAWVRGARGQLRGPEIWQWLYGLTAIAAVIAVGTTIVSVKERNFCSIIDCISLNAFLRYHLPFFLADFTALSWILLKIILCSFIVIQLIKNLIGDAYDDLSTKGRRPKTRDTK